jgi:hypothetical protein
MKVGCSVRDYLGSGSLLVKRVVRSRMRWRTRKSGRVKDSQPEQVEAGAAIHLPLDQLQTVYLPFHHPVAPRQLQRCGDSILVPPEVGRKGCIRGAFRGLEPSRPRCSIPFADDLEQTSSNVCERSDLRRGTVERFQIAVPYRVCFQHQPCDALMPDKNRSLRKRTCLCFFGRSEALPQPRANR